MSEESDNKAKRDKAPEDDLTLEYVHGFVCIYWNMFMGLCVNIGICSWVCV